MGTDFKRVSFQGSFLFDSFGSGYYPKETTKPWFQKVCMYFSIATPSMKTVISFRPGVNIKTNSIKLSHKQSLEKSSRQNEVCYNNKAFVWDANMTVISF